MQVNIIIIPDNEDVEDYIKQGYNIMDVPIEEKQKFVLDMERSLMDIAAVSISYVTKFLNYNISRCISMKSNEIICNILIFIDNNINQKIDIGDLAHRFYINI